MLIVFELLTFLFIFWTWTNENNFPQLQTCLFIGEGMIRGEIELSFWPLKGHEPNMIANSVIGPPQVIELLSKTANLVDPSLLTW